MSFTSACALSRTDWRTASLSGSFKLSNDVILKVQPYLWYGYGTGGTQQRTLSETAFLNTATGWDST